MARGYIHRPILGGWQAKIRHGQQFDITPLPPIKTDECRVCYNAMYYDSSETLRK